MTKIQWTNETWNPVTGCTKVSQGCKHCYAERDFPRVYAKTGRKFVDIALHPERLEKPLRWTRPRMIFVNSMSDLFHEDVPHEFIDQVFAVMALCPQHTFQVLTKRPERMRQYLSQTTGPHNLLTRVIHAAQGIKMPRGQHRPDGPGWPYRNVWLGVSVEDQSTADERIALLLWTPAAVRWVSYEPALGPVDFRPWMRPRQAANADGYGGAHGPGWTTDFTTLDWVVVGGESGPGARPFDIDWARSTVKQCKETGVSVFVKQLGAHPTYSDDDTRLDENGWPEHVKWARNGCITLRDRKGGDIDEWPADLRVREWPEVKA